MKAPSTLLVAMLAATALAGLAAFALVSPTFFKVYGESGYNAAGSIALTKSGYLVAGQTTSYSSGDKNAYAVLTDDNGSAVWANSIGAEGNEEATDAIQMADGSFLLVGFSDSYTSGDLRLNDAWAVKLDRRGKQVWSKTYGEEGAIEEARAIVASPDGGYLLVGKVYQVTPRQVKNDFYLLKIDAKGNEQWEKRIGGPENDAAHDVVATKDGYVIIGETESYGKGKSDIWVVGVDKNGEKQWDATYGGYDNEAGHSIAACKGGGYAICGFTYTEELLVQPGNSMDAWVLKIGQKGEEQWAQAFGGLSTEAAHGVVESEDGSIVVAGYTEVFQAADPEGGDFTNLSQDGHNVLLVKLSAKGQTLWEKSVGGKGEQRGFSLVEAKDGGFAVAGFTDNMKTIKYTEKDAQGNDVEREKQVKAVDALAMKVTKDGAN